MMLSRLPIEVLLIIIRFVPWLDRCRLRAVSYEWRALIDGLPPGAWPQKRMETIRALHQFCLGGRLVMAMWLVDRFTFPTEAVYGALIRACRRGHLDVASWLVDHFAIDNLRLSILRFAGDEGCLESVEWLREKFGDGPTGAGSRFNVLVDACGRGDSRMAQWAVDHWDKWPTSPYYPRTNFASMENYYFLYGACKKGHLTILQLLIARFGIEQNDVHIIPHSLQSCACKNGRLEVAQWLVEAFDLTIANVRFRRGYSGALAAACFGGSLHVAQWLVDHFRLRPRDMLGVGWYGRGENYAAAQRWLAARFA